MRRNCRKIRRREILTRSKRRLIAKNQHVHQCFQHYKHRPQVHQRAFWASESKNTTRFGNFRLKQNFRVLAFRSK